MADIALNGDELKKLVKIAKKRVLNFAYCPGNDPKEDVFVLDRKKKPEVMGRVARAEGTGSKLAFGTVRVKGRIMALTCDREMPQTAKKLKKFLKFEKVPMNVLVMDKDGNVLEEDIEDLPEDLELDSDDEDDADENAETSDNKDEGADDGARLKQLTGRAQKVKTSIGGLAPDAQAAMTKGFAVVLSALKGKDLDKADNALAKLEAAIDKLDAKGNDAAPDPALTQLRGVADGLQQRIEALGNGDGVARLMAAQKVLVDQIDSGDVKKATGTAKALGGAITRAEEQMAAAAEAGENQDDTNDATAEDALDDGAQWRDARADLEPVALDLLQRNLGDVSKMRAVLGYFIEKAKRAILPVA